MRGVAVTISAALLAGTAGPGAAAPRPAPLTATAVGPWQVDYGDTQCLAVRKFTAGTLNFLVALAPEPGSSGLDLLIRLDRAPAGLGTGFRHSSASVDTHAFDPWVNIRQAPDGGTFLFTSLATFGEKDPFVLATARELLVQSGPLSLRIPLDAMAKVAPPLEDCKAGLLERWGFSRADQARMATWPDGAIENAFRSDDYPSQSIANLSQGSVLVSFRVGTDGRGSDCAVRMSSGDKMLDDKTCEVINRRLRMTPARDAAGVPMTTVSTARIRWVIPSG